MTSNNEANSFLQLLIQGATTEMFASKVNEFIQTQKKASSVSAVQITEMGETTQIILPFILDSKSIELLTIYGKNGNAEFVAGLIDNYQQLEDTKVYVFNGQIQRNIQFAPEESGMRNFEIPRKYEGKKGTVIRIPKSLNEINTSKISEQINYPVNVYTHSEKE